jgi:hypothetical protein
LVKLRGNGLALGIRSLPFSVSPLCRVEIHPLSRRMNTHLLHPRSDLTGSALEKREEQHEFVTQEFIHMLTVSLDISYDRHAHSL